MSQNVHVVWLFVNNFKQVLEQPTTSFPPPPNRTLRKTKQKINNTKQQQKHITVQRSPFVSSSSTTSTSTHIYQNFDCETSIIASVNLGSCNQPVLRNEG